MTNAEIIATIRAEVERRRKQLNYNDPYSKRACRQLDPLLSFLSDLEKSIKHDVQDVPARKNCHEDEVNEMLAKIDAETLSQLRDTEKSVKPMKQEADLEKELNHLIVWKYDSTPDDKWDIVVARYFYDLGCRRTAVKFDEFEYNRQRAEDSVPKDLEEAAEEYAGNSVSNEGIMEVAAFIAGAKWDREQMMSKAIEATLDNTAYPTRLWFNTYLSEYSNNDKVRVIIIKKEDK